MKSRIGRPSPALIIAVIALVFALAGTGYAAFKVPKKSIGTAQLKSNAVTNAKVKNNTLTGKKLKLSTLGTVPTATNATHANVADLANSLPLPGLHVIGAPGEPGFLEGAQNVPSGGPIAITPASFFKDHDGVVHLEGFVLPGSGPLLFSLPPGYRPASGRLVVFQQSENTVVAFGSNTFSGGQDLSGTVLVSEPEVTSLTGLTFRAES
ncbi:MAG TPA: hypothetical protein VMS60_09680 [Solirubrobacterales bacterium]|nr:hypothetical protein [Solirubrobacterales bacterium]